MSSSLRLRWTALASLAALTYACASSPPRAVTVARADIDGAASWPTEACVRQTEALLSQMTLPEKLGQMVQAEHKHLEKGDVGRYFLGSLLSGGGSYEGTGSAADWVAMTNAFHAEARATRLGVPLAYAVDAVHGHGGVTEATIFPHHIGLGCTRDPELVRAIGRATAIEVAGTGVDWDFAPVIAAGRDPRWGRTYETFSDRPELAALLGAAEVRGLQGDRLGAGEASVMATAKHFAGDGATTFETSPQARYGGLLDRGDVRLNDADFRRLAVDQYRPVISAGVASVMVSFSSLRGAGMHESRKWLTDVLRNELGFRGIVISDWSGLRELPGTYDEQVIKSVNAGIDVTMDAEIAGNEGGVAGVVPPGMTPPFREFLEALERAVHAGRVSEARVDEAVRRVLTVKCEAGLWRRSGEADPRLTAQIGSPAHRALARRAVRASLVLLQNEGDVLPLSKTARILVAGSGADSPARQSGGWTMSWQKADRPFTATTVLAGLREVAGDASRVRHSPDGSSIERPDVAVLVASEPPYAEWLGDARDPTLSSDDLAALGRLQESGAPVVVVLLAGRPLVIEPYLRKARAWVAAWLPGSEGGGVADVLFGDSPFSGKLARPWPRRMTDLPVDVAREIDDPLFPFGFGLTYRRGAVRP
ncbi:MAG: glycoside hydrolase family 3 C-terminal domain-containing protein [Labilithrix sp.]|nr:glycoside hydrolase family 3 C-terminal domain-containing protein [Labilithrix sp.]